MPETEHLVHCNKASLKIFYLLLFFQLNIFCQVYPNHSIDSTLKAGIKSIIIQNYSDAENTFLKLDRNFPDLPLGKIYLAAVKIAMSYDLGEEYDDSTIVVLLNSAIDQSELLLDKNSSGLWNKYFLSLAVGYKAYFEALNENWFTSLSDGVTSLKNFEQILESDSNFYEAQIAIGTFKYWKSRKTEFLNWLPGYTDERDEGIKLLQKSIRSAAYNTYLAINSLIWIYIDQDNFVNAKELAESALKEYPGSRFFMWGLARAYENINPEKSVEIYTKILNSLPYLPNHYNEIILKHLIAQQYLKMGNNYMALKMCKEILSLKIPDEKIQSKLEERLKRVLEMKQELTR
jgi:hypothetical protein